VGKVDLRISERSPPQSLCLKTFSFTLAIDSNSHNMSTASLFLIRPLPRSRRGAVHPPWSGPHAGVVFRSDGAEEMPACCFSLSNLFAVPPTFFFAALKAGYRRDVLVAALALYA